MVGDSRHVGARQVEPKAEKTELRSVGGVVKVRDLGDTWGCDMFEDELGDVVPNADLEILVPEIE